MCPPSPDSTSSANPGPDCREIEVIPPITLGQFIKLADLASSGGEAKELIAAGEVRVNGEVESRRGRKLASGDRVHLGAAEVVVKETGSSGAPEWDHGRE